MRCRAAAVPHTNSESQRSVKTRAKGANQRFHPAFRFLTLAARRCSYSSKTSTCDDAIALCCTPLPPFLSPSSGARFDTQLLSLLHTIHYYTQLSPQKALTRQLCNLAEILAAHRISRGRPSQ